MADKLRVGVVFGGRSGEHEVSLSSAQSVMDAMDAEAYEIVPIGITKDGAWIFSGDPMAALRSWNEAGDQPTGSAIWDLGFAIGDLDVVFPVLHGPYGEDGTMQGFLELADVPYVGAGVTASALAMDKILFKGVMKAQDMPIVEQVTLKRKAWEADRPGTLERIEASLDYPVFTKPANLGSSVGISKCYTRTELTEGLTEAARFDRKIVVEKAVPEAREIEVSVLGNDDPIASVPGEIVPSREFYSYEAKYLDSGDEASDLLIPAPLSPEMTAHVQALAVQVYQAIDCAGMARVDFLLSDATETLYVNEVNTLPGFTEISMYPKLWEASGIPYSDLIDRLIELALERYRDKARTEISYAPAES